MRRVDSRLELFVDDWLIEESEGITLKLHSPIPKEICIEFSESWEGSFSTYVTVMRDEEGGYRMYYRGSGRGNPEVTCLARSEDGVNWIKPCLQLFSIGGSKENNIIWVGDGTHNFTPFRDENPNCSPDERYKAVAGAPLRAFASSDGVHWKKLRDTPIITVGTFDSQNLAFWDKEKERYVCYLRDYLNGIRSIRRSLSQDFINWSHPEWINFGDTPLEHLYTNAIIPYFRAPHIYLAFPKRFVPNRHLVREHPEPGVSDAVFMSSRDGLNWNRRFMEGFIRPGCERENWTHRSNMPAWGILQTGEKELSIYYTQHYFHSGCSLRRAVLRLDGFVSVNAGYSGGEFLTYPLHFKGKDLLLNYATSAVGWIRVELKDEFGRQIPGYESDELYGDEIDYRVVWRGGEDLSRVEDGFIRLKFFMKDADLYSIQFKD
jgi:hypothetical protein